MENGTYRCGLVGKVRDGSPISNPLRVLMLIKLNEVDGK